MFPVLLDHGLYKDLEDGFRSDFCKLWKALILRDQKGIKETGEKLGAGEYYKYLPVLFTGRTTDRQGHIINFLVNAVCPESSHTYTFVF